MELVTPEIGERRGQRLQADLGPDPAELRGRSMGNDFSQRDIRPKQCAQA